MLVAHTGVDMTKAEFDALVSDLIDAMDELEISEFNQNGLLRILSPMESDIVGK
jgi:hemoglobin